MHDEGQGVSAVIGQEGLEQLDDQDTEI